MSKVRENGLPSRHDYIPFFNERDSTGKLLTKPKGERILPTWQKNLDLIKKAEKDKKVPPVQLDLDTVKEWQEVSDLAVKNNVEENRFLLTDRSNNGQCKISPEEHQQLAEKRIKDQQKEYNRRERKKLEIYQESLKQANSVQAEARDFFERRSNSNIPVIQKNIIVAQSQQEQRDKKQQDTTESPPVKRQMTTEFVSQASRQSSVGDAIGRLMKSPEYTDEGAAAGLSTIEDRQQSILEAHQISLINAGSRLSGASHIAYRDARKAEKAVEKMPHARAKTQLEKHGQIPDLNTYGTAAMERQNIQSLMPAGTKCFKKAVGHQDFIVRSEADRAQPWFQSIGMPPVSTLKQGGMPRFEQQQERNSVSYLAQLDQDQKNRREDLAQQRYLHRNDKLLEQADGLRRARQEKYVYNLPVEIRKYHPSRKNKLQQEIDDTLSLQFATTNKDGLGIGQKVRKSVKKQREDLAEMKENAFRLQIEEQNRSRAILNQAEKVGSTSL